MGARTKAQVQDYSVGLQTTDIIVLPSTLGRNFLYLANGGPGSCAITFNGAKAVMNANGNIILPANQRLIFQKNVPQSEIHAISASTSALTVQSDDTISTVGQPFWILNPGNPPAVDFDFRNNRYWISPNQFTTAPITVTRSGTNATNLVPTSASGFAFTTYAANTPRITPGPGLLMEESRVNQLFPSTAPSNQTTGSLANGTYTLWVNGSGSATSSAGTAVGAGFGAATQGSPNIFTITNPGTVVVTVAGSLNAFQLELGTFGTSLIVTAAATGTRSADTIGTVLLPPAIGSAETLFAQVNCFAPTGFTGTQWLAELDDGNSNNRAALFRANATGQLRFITTSGGVTQGNIVGPGVIAQATTVKAAGSNTAGSQSDALNGGNNGTASGALSPVMSVIRVGCDPAGNQCNGFVERVAVWPTINLPTATLNTLTT